MASVGMQIVSSRAGMVKKIFASSTVGSVWVFRGVRFKYTHHDVTAYQVFGWAYCYKSCFVRAVDDDGAVLLPTHAEPGFLFTYLEHRGDLCCAPS
jgi:hypothetical protein